LGEAARFNVLCCGRRWGKTTIALDRIIAGILNQQKVAWFSPIYKDLAEAWRYLAQTLKPVTVRRNDSEHRLEVFGGGSLDGWSLDNPDSGRGRAYHLIVLDEAAKVADLKQAWDTGLRPMLTDYEGGAWFLSTPRGTANYFHKLYLEGQDGSKPDWASWQMPTSVNPHIKPGEVEIAKRDLTDLAFAQEYLAQFVTWTGAVFRRISDAVYPEGTSTAPCAMIGADWGRTNDYTVFTAVSQRGEVIEIDRFRGIEYTLQRQRLRTMWERQGKRAWILAELNSMGGPVVEQLQRDGLPVVGFQTTAVSKAAIIEHLTLAFERGLIRIPNDPVLIGELQAFESKPLPSGLIRYSAPEGQHDDTVMSLAFAWYGLVAPREETRHLDPNSGLYVGQPVEYRISPV
jgi:hypothetical protein